MYREENHYWFPLDDKETITNRYPIDNISAKLIIGGEWVPEEAPEVK